MLKQDLLSSVLGVALFQTLSKQFNRKESFSSIVSSVWHTSMPFHWGSTVGKDEIVSLGRYTTTCK
jgi:hypothetical protein